jgi:hypothetical protein
MCEDSKATAYLDLSAQDDRSPLAAIVNFRARVQQFGGRRLRNVEPSPRGQINIAARQINIMARSVWCKRLLRWH